MGDFLEKLAKESRDQFDTGVPSNNVWSRINHGLERDGASSWKRNLWKYAAILFLVSTVVLLTDRLGVRSSESVQTAEASDFDQIEHYYTQLIEEKQDLLTTYESEALEESFRNDLDQLDDLYAELKDQFENDIGDQKVKDAMIINLKIRLDILSRQIEILEKLNDSEDESQEIDFS